MYVCVYIYVTHHGKRVVQVKFGDFEFCTYYDRVYHVVLRNVTLKAQFYILCKLGGFKGHCSRVIKGHIELCLAI